MTYFFLLAGSVQSSAKAHRLSHKPGPTLRVVTHRRPGFFDESLHRRSYRLIFLKKSERIDSTYTELDRRPIYALQAFLAGQAYCGERSSPTTYA